MECFGLDLQGGNAIAWWLPNNILIPSVTKSLIPSPYLRDVIYECSLRPNIDIGFEGCSLSTIIEVPKTGRQLVPNSWACPILLQREDRIKTTWIKKKKKYKHGKTGNSIWNCQSTRFKQVLNNGQPRPDICIWHSQSLFLKWKFIYNEIKH